MARPLRIEFSDALYPVTSRGNERRDIFLAEEDRLQFLDVLGDVSACFNGCCHAYCLMTNQDHLLVETPDANLSKRRPPPRELSDYAAHYPNTDRAMAEAYRRGGYSLQAIGAFFGVSRMTVSWTVKKIEAGCEERDV